MTTTKFNHGDIAKWKYAYAASEAECADRFIVLEPADDGRCLIRPVGWDGGRFVPTMLTSLSYLERA